MCEALLNGRCNIGDIVLYAVLYATQHRDDEMEDKILWAEHTTQGSHGGSHGYQLSETIRNREPFLTLAPITPGLVIITVANPRANKPFVMVIFMLKSILRCFVFVQ